MDSLALPPSMNCAPEFCLCGRKTIESHEFWFCSTECARLDSLRSLDSPECHYRNVVRAYVRTGTPPRRMTSAGHLRSKQRVLANPPLPATFAPSTANAGFPTLAQVTGKVLTKKATAGEPLVAQRHDRPRWEGFPNTTSHARIAQRPRNHPFEQVSLDATPLLDQVQAQARILRRVPSLSDGLRSDVGKPSVAKRLNFGRSQKAKEPERIFGHPIHHAVLPVNPPSEAAKVLSAIKRNSLMHIVEEMREGLSENFDPRSLFDKAEDY